MKKENTKSIPIIIVGFSGFSSNTNRTSYGLNSILVSGNTQSLILEQPYVYTIDTFITPIELVLVLIATFVSAYFASITITSKKAINILRESLK